MQRFPPETGLDDALATPEMAAQVPCDGIEKLGFVDHSQQNRFCHRNSSKKNETRRTRIERMVKGRATQKGDVICSGGSIALTSGSRKVVEDWRLNNA